ncbi:DUF4112 domain-containing protein [Maritimibacter sp. DP1N21-5]|uniref:DUF4112 domain-containing protein n=1 Tax=Maritimibacter sp. DP1N21-5 TaxID=2836867 RepID=UPI001C43B37F|nr:DUF4112 domain-containing protein [Maritimibacter sp. DP1N21-5]MBV7408026.1 DUF4112 domain-containing protein [Maritimibacter sp. DP1N21-5]
MPADRTLPRATPLNHTNAAADLARVQRIARLFDTRYGIPGTRLRFGLDSIIGLIPGIGDIAMLAPSVYILAVAMRHNVPKATLARMVGNAAIDAGVGSIPILGDIFDLFFKSHRRNADLLAEALGGPRT